MILCLGVDPYFFFFDAVSAVELLIGDFGDASALFGTSIGKPPVGTETIVPIVVVCFAVSSFSSVFVSSNRFCD